MISSRAWRPGDPHLKGERKIIERYYLASSPRQPTVLPRPSEEIKKVARHHNTLPFDLRHKPLAFSEGSNRQLLMNMYPHIQRVEFDEWVLVFLFNELPIKPWPRKIAGVPCFFTTDPCEKGPTIPMQCKSRSLIDLAPEIDLRENEYAMNMIFNLVRDFFKDAKIPITEIQCWGRVVVIVLEYEANKDETLKAVPKSVACCNCFYLFECEMGRPATMSAVRKKIPTNTEGDDSTYKLLRPGVLLSSSKHPKDGKHTFTTSGVLLEDCMEEKYLTVAAHGFPSRSINNEVYHPGPDGTEIGQFILELGRTDVGLVALNDGIEFINEPFQNDVVKRPPVKLRGLARADQVAARSPIYLDSPFTGYIEGTKGPHCMRRFPSDAPLTEPKQIWIKCNWTYMGQGASSELALGAYGSPIWDEHHRVIGFFCYCSAAGQFADYCSSVSADHLLDCGYKLA